MLLTDPHKAVIPSCEDCQKWVYDPETWQPAERPKGKKVPRQPDAVTPCYRCPKSRDCKPNPGAELSPKNWDAYHWFLQCEADTTGILPRDRIVIQNNAIIKWVQNGAERSQFASVADLIGLTVAASAGGRQRGSRT